MNPGPVNWEVVEKWIEFNSSPKKKDAVNDEEGNTAKPKSTYSYELLLRYSRLRVLNALEMSYRQQYEKGLCTPPVFITLQNFVNNTRNMSKSQMIKVENILNLFEKKHIIRRLLLHLFDLLDMDRKLRKPKNLWRAFFYTVKRSCTFKFICMVVDIYLFLYLIFRVSHFFEILLTSIILGTIDIFLSFTASSRHGYMDAIKRNLMSFTLYNIIVWIISILKLTLDICNNRILSTFLRILLLIIIIIRLCGNTFRIVFASFPKFEDFVRYKIHDNLMYLYILGQTYIKGNDDAIRSVENFLVKDARIERSLIKTLNRYKQEVMEKMALLVKHHPWVLVTVKTKYAMYRTLQNTKRNIDEMKDTGRVDESEYLKLMNSYEDQLLFLNKFEKRIYPQTAEEIFSKVPWINILDSNTKNYLLKNVETQFYLPLDVIYSEGDKPIGVYIIALGNARVTYTPNSEVLEALNVHGELPVVELTPNMNFKMNSEHVIMKDFSFGEMGVLTGRHYNSRVMVETPCMCYLLPLGCFHTIFENNSSPYNNMEAAMWKHATTMIAYQLLMESRAFTSTKEEIFELVDRAFIPNLKDYKIFVVHSDIEELLLIEGIILDIPRNKMYIAPCCIPRNVEKIALSKSHLLRHVSNIFTKMMIIPARDIKQADLMKSEERISEIWSRTSGRYLYQSLTNIIESPQEDIDINDLEVQVKEDVDEYNLPGTKRTPWKLRKSKYYRDMRLSKIQGKYKYEEN
ncbi:sodium/hydrogen exchanger 10-like isoform X2 [Aethina tumida]|uniref:sodium/hydrogen exchanger 10-like isoform X2 n=1 Tax=Aethina tumida TaxID=116153 RepID=UPI0021482794|nr:sodium/hydrogen exchanger 10-like isoform X2 [Aethina tumida]